MEDDITAGWYRFVENCNNPKDPSYPDSHVASLDRTELEERWKKECPGLEVPVVYFSHESGKHELRDLSRPKPNIAS